MNVLIVEDEPYAAERLALILNQTSFQINILAQLDSIAGVVNYVNSGQLSPDIVFMDIELADGKCFDIFNQVKIDWPVIFTTAYDQYALKAFDINSIHYLLKPVRKQDVEKAISKYQSLGQDSSINLKAVRDLLEGNKTQFRTRFLGKYGSKLIHKEVSAITYFFSEDRLVYMVDKERRKYLLDVTLDELENQLLDRTLFYRVSRKFIVNINAVEILKRYSQQRVQLFLSFGQEHEIIVSREKVSNFKIWLSK